MNSQISNDQVENFEREIKTMKKLIEGEYDPERKSFLERLKERMERWEKNGDRVHELQSDKQG